VFKEYLDDFEAWRREIDIFGTLPRQKGRDRIVEFLGAFEQSERRLIILEKATESLLDVFERNQIPPDLEQRYRLWYELMMLLEGIHLLQNMRVSQYGVNGTHGIQVGMYVSWLPSPVNGS
jgi:hypothetical protein